MATVAAASLISTPLRSFSLPKSFCCRRWGSTWGPKEGIGMACSLMFAKNCGTRRTAICAVNQDAEKSFKKTVEVDHLIDMLKVANARELDQLVVENVLAFNEDFWIRLAARTDTCKSDDDKAWFSTWSIFFLTMFHI
ncbi:hypothetical protein BHM03_00056755 [Ensete ventricosum]|nr:hypothetical protein BHM03_00056755 [Ensete ventricosum]